MIMNTSATLVGEQTVLPQVVVPASVLGYFEENSREIEGLFN